MARWPQASQPSLGSFPWNPGLDTRSQVSPLPCPLLPSPVSGKCVELSVRGFVYLAEFFPPVQGQVAGHSYS